MELALGQPNLQVMAVTLLELAQADQNIVVLTSDSRGSGKLGEYAQALPDQLVEVGIAEQNLVGIAAGLAAAGKKAIAVSPASFLTARSLEQIKNDVAYSDQPVKLIGISSGVSYGALGSTHHAIHDYAVLRAINNLDVIAPADNFETREAIKAAVQSSRPLYIRFGKQPMHHLHDAQATQFAIGKAITIKSGTDVTFIATGEPTYRAYQAAQVLEAEGISSRVISMHTVKPLDTDTLLQAARETRAIVTVEEHSVMGGLGEACASTLMQAGVSIPFKIMGFPDEDTVTGSQYEIFDHYGLSAAGLSAAARKLLQLELA
jgi:transketolase